jgi:hypothetical protein
MTSAQFLSNPFPLRNYRVKIYFFYFLFFVETGSYYVIEAALKLTMKFRLFSNFCSSCLSLVSDVITGICHLAQLNKSIPVSFLSNEDFVLFFF